MEILITALIVIAVVFILYKNFKKSSKGQCSGYSGCASKGSCPSRKDNKK